MDLSFDPALGTTIRDAVQSAMPATVERFFKNPTSLQRLTEKQRPLVPLLIVLLDFAQTTAAAIADNAWDDSCPIDRELAQALANQSHRIGADITNATQCPNASAWSLPSCTGKELV